MQRCNIPHTNHLLGAIVVAVLAYVIGPVEFSCNKVENNLNVDMELYGRENELKILSSELLFGDDSVVELIGIAGVGKTALALNITNRLIKEHGYCRIYVDVSDHSTISSLINDLINNQCCMTMLALFTPSGNQHFSSWYESQQSKTILILDEADLLMDDIEQNILEPVAFTRSTKKIVLISHFSKRRYLKRPVLLLSGMSTDACATWINSKYDGRISYDKCEQLCHELGGVPREVESIVRFVMHPLTSGSIGEVITELRNEEYGKAFAYLESILGRQYEDTEVQNRAMYLLYSRLEFEHRICIWLLVELTKHGEFTKDMVKQHLSYDIHVDSCLDSLLVHSFLEVIKPPQKVFKFRPYVKKFIQSIGEPKADVYFVRSNARSFYGKYVFNNAKFYHDTLVNTRDLDMAVDIGSNKQLINSLLPLLGDDYDLRPLFKIALDIIKENYCTSNNIQNSSNTKILSAFDYLTKAVHCPSIHPPQLLSPPKPKLFPKHSSCLQELNGCPAVLSLNKNDYEAAEALGYHNSLLIYAYKSAPWQLSLIDMSLIITVANRECAYYCKSIKFCQCGKHSSFEQGLRQFLLRDNPRSALHFRYTLHLLSSNDSPCKTILKVIAIIGLYSSKSGHLDEECKATLADIDFGRFNFSCFLGVMNDLVVPFLVEVGHRGSHELYSQVNQTIEIEEQYCDKEAKTDQEKLDCNPTVRYTIGHGLVALKMTELQINSSWPKEVTEYASREEWVCSIIRDKTAKCKEALPLFSEVRLIETNKNYDFLKAMKYFMDNKEYLNLKKSALDIPMFFQLMSI